MKTIFTLLLFGFMLTMARGQSPPVDSVKQDTIPLVLLFSYCQVCAPQTDWGYMIYRKELGKKDGEIAGYLTREGRPYPKGSVVWMVHKPPTQ